jgi:arsenate reductase
MAEAFLRAYAAQEFEVHSAGIDPKDHILPEVIQVMSERGLGLEGQRPKGIEEYLGRMHFAHVITVCGNAEEKCPTVFLNMGNHEHWPFDDPAKFKGDAIERRGMIRVVREQIDRRVRRWLEEQNVSPAVLAPGISDRIS